MMTPLHIKLLLHYSIYDEKFPHPSEAATEYTEELQRMDLIIFCSGNKSGYKITAKGEAHIQGILNLELPIWTSPATMRLTMKKLLLLAFILIQSSSFQIRMSQAQVSSYYGTDRSYQDDGDKNIEQNEYHCHLIWTKGDKPGYLRVWVEVEGKLIPAMYIPDGYVRPGGGWAFYHEWTLNGTTLPLRVLPAFWVDAAIEAWVSQLPSEAAKIDWRTFLKKKRQMAMENLRKDLADEWGVWHCDVRERVLILPTVRARGLYFGKTWNLIAQEDREFYVKQFETWISIGKLQQKLAEVLAGHDLQIEIAEKGREYEQRQQEERRQHQEEQQRENERRAYEDAQRQYGGGGN